MSYEFNRVTLTGYVGTDPEMHYPSNGGNGVPRLSFRFAHSRGQDKTDWFSVKFWGERAERAASNQSIQKGDHILVDGKLVIEEGQDGRIYPTIHLDVWKLLRRKESAAAEAQPAAVEEEIPV
jgi:single-stranded DNA-binding protein